MTTNTLDGRKVTAAVRIAIALGYRGVSEETRKSLSADLKRLKSGMTFEERGEYEARIK